MKKNHYVNRLRNLAIAAVVLAIGCIGTGCNEDPVVTPPSDVVDGVYTTSSNPLGKTYAEWSADWWKWAFQTPATDSAENVIHPLLDTTGQFAGNGQSASAQVYYLAGFLGSGTYSRTVTIPAGKAIFFPIFNRYLDTVGNWTIDSMRYYRDTLPSPTPELSVEVDGHAISSPQSYRFKSELFTATLPNRNLYQHFGNPLPAGHVMPYLSDGYWIMLAPLSKGVHTIHFKGKQGAFDLKMTYNITVQ